MGASFGLEVSLSVREARVNMRRVYTWGVRLVLGALKENECCDYADCIVGNKTILFAAIIRQAWGWNNSIEYYYNFLFCSKTTFVQSTISYKYPALANTTELVLVFKMPSFVVYEQYSSNGSLSPDDVTESQDGNFRFVTFKVSKF